MKVNVDFNITILDGPEAGKSFKNSYIDETRPRPGFNGLLIEELIMKWSYMPPYQRIDDFKEDQNESSIKPYIINYELGNPGTYLSLVADLCPECQEKLEMWMSCAVFKKPEVVKNCDNCKYKEYAYNSEPCFSCSSIGNYKAWKPKEDQND